MTRTHHRNHPARRSAFTLIELLAGMAILSILVLMLGRFFTESTRAWDTGTKQAEMNSTGRAIMDFVVSDLSTAVADDILKFRLDSNNFPTYWPTERSDMVVFDSLGESPEASQPRSAARITYYVRQLQDVNGVNTGRFRLMRNRTKDPAKIYSGSPISNPLASGSATPIAENVVSFNIWAYPNASSADIPGYNSDTQGGLPIWVDIYLEMLAESDAKRAALLAGNVANQQAFVREHAKGFLARAYFPNRIGYSK